MKHFTFFARLLCLHLYIFFCLHRNIFWEKGFVFDRATEKRRKNIFIWEDGMRQIIIKIDHFLIEVRRMRNTLVLSWKLLTSGVATRPPAHPSLKTYDIEIELEKFPGGVIETCFWGCWSSTNNWSGRWEIFWSKRIALQMCRWSAGHPKTCFLWDSKPVWGNSNSVYFIMDFPALFNYNIIS